MTDWKEEFDEAMLRIWGYTYLDNRLTKEYLPGLPMLPREVHLLETIIHHPGANLTELAQRIGVLKGTVSKMTRKLESDGLLETFRQNGNLKEVHFRSTALGRKLFDAHNAFHKVNGREFYGCFEGLPEEQKALIVDTLCRYGDYMKEYCDARLAQQDHEKCRGDESDEH